MGSIGRSPGRWVVLEDSPVEVSTSNTTPVGNVRCFSVWLMGSAGGLSCPGAVLEVSPIEGEALEVF